VAVGGSSEDLRYLKSISLHLWLFGYELPGGDAGSGECPNDRALRQPRQPSC
jgi:hypothetical protein